MAHLVRHSRKPSRAGYPARHDTPPRVSTILCMIIGGMTLVVLAAKALAYLLAAT